MRWDGEQNRWQEPEFPETTPLASIRSLFREDAPLNVKKIVEA